MTATLKGLLERDRSVACAMQVFLTRAEFELVMEALELRLRAAGFVEGYALPMREDWEQETQATYRKLVAIRDWSPPAHHFPASYYE